MEIVFSLVGISIVLVLAIAIVFIWAIRSGQFEDMEGPAWRVVMDDDRTSAQIARERETVASAEDSAAGVRKLQDETAQKSASKAELLDACDDTATKNSQSNCRIGHDTEL